MDLTVHFTARTDDSHAAPVIESYYFNTYIRPLKNQTTVNSHYENHNDYKQHVNLSDAKNGKIIRGISN